MNMLIADDEQLVRHGLRMILDAADDIEVIGEAGDGDEPSPWPGNWPPTWSCWTSACPAPTN
ncbi:hypothetical protein [Streptomyces sp. YIM 98790]|uniref:response regulator transcription factor n=1 Tax=Streptomyces sp. YIM 98790 TaxID=2689077 RepID=UPI0028BF4952|nr:hypothetical protein [Streptomyces sp. YIM 98790]